ncbi:MAG: flagellar motor switch protein FliN [bacterium]|nr:flagellar motor switch protein FliN [bacterium]
MGDGSLSQDEIDALLMGADDTLTSPAPPAAMEAGGGGGALSPAEQNNLRETVNTAASSVASSLSALFSGKSFTISNVMVELKPQEAVRSDFPAQYVQVTMDYSGVLNGKNLIIFNLSDAGSLSAVMMGSEPGSAPATLDEAHQSTIQELTNQFLAAMATQFGNRLGGGINTSPATVSMVNNAAELQLPFGELIKVTYDFVIDGVVNSKFFQIMDLGVASGLSRGGGGGGMPAGQSAGSQPQQMGPQVGISPVKFPPLDEGMSPAVGDISLLLDVPMTLTVELGRTKRLVQEILGLGEGSIIELDKLAGEPVDLLVNGKLIAKGEVVVIDENFGVRVTDIVSPDERLTSLNG